MTRDRLKVLKAVAPRFADRNWLEQYAILRRQAERLGLPIASEVDCGFRIWLALSKEWQTSRRLNQDLDLGISDGHLRVVLRVLQEHLPIERSWQGYRKKQ